MIDVLTMRVPLMPFVLHDMSGMGSVIDMLRMFMLHTFVGSMFGLFDVLGVFSMSAVMFLMFYMLRFFRVICFISMKRMPVVDRLEVSSLVHFLTGFFTGRVLVIHVTPVLSDIHGFMLQAFIILFRVFALGRLGHLLFMFHWAGLGCRFRSLFYGDILFWLLFFIASHRFGIYFIVQFLWLFIPVMVMMLLIVRGIVFRHPSPPKVTLYCPYLLLFFLLRNSYLAPDPTCVRPLSCWMCSNLKSAR
jgi:hypothetical protein